MKDINELKAHMIDLWADELNRRQTEHLGDVSWIPLPHAADYAYGEESRQRLIAQGGSSVELAEMKTIDTWVVSWDTGDKGWGRIVVLDTNDDGYFTTMIGKWTSWDDNYELEGLAAIGSDDDNFYVIPIHKED